jgi:hypothetical protein
VGEGVPGGNAACGTAVFQVDEGAPGFEIWEQITGTTGLSTTA